MFWLFLLFSLANSVELLETCEKSITNVLGTYAPQETICSGHLIFDENFDKLDTNLWQHEKKLGNLKCKEFQWYDDSLNNSYVDNGILHIRPTLTSDEYGEDFLYSGEFVIENCTSFNRSYCSKKGSEMNIINPIKSARLNTNSSFAFKYGKVEVRLRAPSGDWLWPAFWMMPRDTNKYHQWPGCGEIDIYEARGNQNLTREDIQVGLHQAGSTLHWGPSSLFDKYKLTDFKVQNSDGFDKSFHRFQMIWSPDNITLSLDDSVTGVIIPPDGGFWELGDLESSGLDNPWRCASKMAPFDSEFYFIANVAVGGVTFFSDFAQNFPEPKPWLNNSTRPANDFWEARNQWLPGWKRDTDQSHLEIDYIRVWAL